MIQPTLFHGHVDLNFKVDEDEYKAYRALKLTDPTVDMSGDYRCKVSTFEDEGFVDQKLSIFGLWLFLKRHRNVKLSIFSAPPKNVSLKTHIDAENLDVTCFVDEVFPEPIVKLLWNERYTLT